MRLPLEIFCDVLKHVDADTLENLEKAFLMSQRYHAAVLQHRWRNVAIESQTLIDKALRAPTFRGEQLHAEPATYIQHLRSTHTKDTKRFPCLEENFFPVFSLLLRCTSLRELDSNGPLKQEELEIVVSRLKDSLEALRLLIPTPNLKRQPIKWDCLALMTNLRRLEIGDFMFHDPPSFVWVVGKLQNLEVLTILEIDHVLYSEENNPLLIFLRELLCIDPSLGRLRFSLPPRLKSLALCDTSESFTSAKLTPPHRPESFARVSLPLLEDLFFNHRDPLLIKKTLDWWELPSLKRLTVPSVTPDIREGPHTSKFSTSLIQDEVVQPLMVRCVETLQQVVLVDVWQARSNERIIRPLANQKCGFTVTDLVCGTLPRKHFFDHLPPQYRTFRQQLRETMQNCKLCRKLFEVHQFHPFLVRLRIEQLHFYDGVIGTIFQDLFFPKLRILMLYPWQRDLDIPMRSLKRPPSLNEIPEGRVAQSILSQGFPEMRILAIGRYRFWLAKEKDHTKEPDATLDPLEYSSRVWLLEEALRNRPQAAEIDRSLDARDWTFMNDLPEHPQKQDPYACLSCSGADTSHVDKEVNVVYKRVENRQMAMHRNYVVLHRTDFSPRETSQDRKLSSLYGRPLHWLHNMPSWSYESTIRAITEGEQLARSESPKGGPFG